MSDSRVLTGLSTFVMKNVFRPAILKASSRFSPNAGSTSNSPCRKLRVFSEMWTRLTWFMEIKKKAMNIRANIKERPRAKIGLFLNGKKAYWGITNIPGLSTWFHFVCQLNILWVNVILPLALTENSCQNCSGVHTYPHVDRRVCLLLNVSGVERND